jgi:hypothetical protein
MQRNDAEQLLKLYQQFALHYVGSAARTLKSFQRMARTKDNLGWVALAKQGKIVGYVSATYAKGRRAGRIHEIIVDPQLDFTTVACPLAEKVHDILTEKGAAIIQAASIRNPYYPQIFPKLGFFEVETDGIFMYAIIDTAKFLTQISPIIAHRLKQLPSFNGLLQITCEQNSAFFMKDEETVQSLLATNYNADCKILLTTNALLVLLLGMVDAQKVWTERMIIIETELSKQETNKLLSVLFPHCQFLALDYW